MVMRLTTSICNSNYYYRCCVLQNCIRNLKKQISCILFRLTRGLCFSFNLNFVTAPDSISPGTQKPLHHDKMVIHAQITKFSASVLDTSAHLIAPSWTNSDFEVYEIRKVKFTLSGTGLLGPRLDQSLARELECLVVRALSMELGRPLKEQPEDLIRTSL